MTTTSSASPKKRPRSLTDEVVNAFSEHMRNGRFSPGAKLPTESDIMREHSVSRTVVREATDQQPRAPAQSVPTDDARIGNRLNCGGFRFRPKS